MVFLILSVEHFIFVKLRFKFQFKFKKDQNNYLNAFQHYSDFIWIRPKTGDCASGQADRSKFGEVALFLVHLQLSKIKVSLFIGQIR